VREGLTKEGRERFYAYEYISREQMIKNEGRIIFLTGAPLSTSLDWKEAALCAPLQPCFSRSSEEPQRSLSSKDAKPAWRSLSLERNHLPTGLTQAPKVDVELDHRQEEAYFLTTDELSFISSSPDEDYLQASQISSNSQNDLLSQYYDHSLAVHEEIPSSQIIDPESSVDTSFSTSYESTPLPSSGDTDISSGIRLPPAGLSFGRVIDLRDVPNAGYIRSIEPQTMTINLVAGIIAIPQPRVIITRKGRWKVELIEMLIGDDTKAGFGINIWLHPPRSVVDGRDMGFQVSQLRPQDIVLLKNVALNSFRGKVYGQSLRKNVTTLDLLYRNTLGVNDRQGLYSAQELEAKGAEDVCVAKVVKVKQWVMTFVGTGATSRQNTMQSGAREGQGVGDGQLIALPPDTQ